MPPQLNHRDPLFPFNIISAQQSLEAVTPMQEGAWMARGEMCSETYKINKQELNDTIILTRDGKVQTGSKLFGSLKSFTPDLINYL